MFDPAIVFAIIVVLVVLAGFLALRALVDAWQARRDVVPGAAGDARFIVQPTEAERAALGMAGRVDTSFDDLAIRTGLGLSPTQSLGIMAVSGLALGLAVYAWTEDPMLAAAGLLVGAVVPYLVFLVLHARRQRLMQGQLPDVFYFMARALRAGLSVEQVLAQCGDQVAEPLAGEFRHTTAHIRLGLRPTFALQLMADRIRLLDFNIFVSTVNLYYTSGGNLPHLLDRLAASTRDRNQFRGYFRAATALGRISATSIALAVPLLLIAYVIIQPEHTNEFLHSGTGWAMIAIALTLEVIGIIWMSILLRVDY